MGIVEVGLDAEIKFTVEGKAYTLTVTEILVQTHLYELREEVEEFRRRDTRWNWRKNWKATSKPKAK